MARVGHPDPRRSVGATYEYDGKESLQEEHHPADTCKLICDDSIAFSRWGFSLAPFSVSSFVAIPTQLHRCLLHAPIENLGISTVAVRVHSSLHDSLKLVCL